VLSGKFIVRACDWRGNGPFIVKPACKRRGKSWGCCGNVYANFTKKAVVFGDTQGFVGLPTTFPVASGLLRMAGRKICQKATTPWCRAEAQRICEIVAKWCTR